MWWMFTPRRRAGAGRLAPSERPVQAAVGAKSASPLARMIRRVSMALRKATTALRRTILSKDAARRPDGGYLRTNGREQEAFRPGSARFHVTAGSNISRLNALKPVDEPEPAPLKRSKSSRLLWVARRLSSMSLPELAHRVREQAQRAADRRLDGGWRRFPATGSTWPEFPGLKESLRAGCAAASRSAIATSTENLIAGRYEALGVAWPGRRPDDLFPADLWRTDPVTGGLWPGAETASTDIAYRHQSRLGSIKYVWEINRLQFLQPLGAHYALTGDARAARAIELCVDSWFAANPPFRGVNWNSGIELAVRAVSLIAATTLCGDALRPDIRQKVRQILAASLHWLVRHPSKYSSANNHLVAEALGLFVIGSLCPDFVGADAAAEHGRAILEREAQLQILADGIGAEQSPTYGALTAEALLTAASLARALGRPVSRAFDERLERFGGALSWFLLPSGGAAAIGDDDEGAVWDTADHRTYAASVAAAVAGYLQRPGFGPTGPQPELRDAIFGSPRTSPSPAAGLKTFPNGGYTAVRAAARGREIHLVLDHGPLGYRSIAAHGHADANAIVLAVDGVPVLIDPGTYMYHAHDEWRTWFRGTRAHNTVCVAGEDQSQIIGPFMWGRKALARLDEATDGADWSLTASHDGYRRRSGADHQRTVSAACDGIVIIDRLHPLTAAAPVEVVFQFAADLDVRQTSDGAELRTDLGWRLSLHFDTPGAVVLSSGGTRCDQGWVSPGFGRKEPAPRLSWTGRLPEAGLKTHIRLGD